MPQATSIPMGPLKLSTHPGTGSSIDETTEKVKMQPNM